LQAKYIKIKNAITDHIELGTWQPAEKIPSENVLAEQFGVSRMTARRALDELCAAGFLVRSQGLGTFVADQRPMSSMLEIHNIADEIAGRGHDYSCRVVKVNRVSSDKRKAMLLSVQEGQEIFHSTLVHLESGIPVQYEDRYVNPKFAPDYGTQDFKLQTPNVYLSNVAPLTEADHIVEAVLPEKAIAKYLKMSHVDPCLKITRRTWSKRGVVSFAYLYHPGDRYRLGSHLNF
jgi:GntR family histidine utilization transcriptional repressor